MKKYVILICIVIILVISGFIGYFVYKAMNSNTDISNVKAKVNQEMKFLDNNIISMMNRFNNITYANYKIVEKEISSSTKESGEEGGNSSAGGQGGTQSQGGSSDSQSQSGASEGEKKAMEISNVQQSGVLINDDNDVDWERIKYEVENIYTNWPSILVDLSSLNVNKDNLVQFTSTLNDIISALESENKGESLIKLSDLYGLMSSYLREYSDDINMINIFSVKSYISRAYALLEYDNRWEEIGRNVSNARAQYTNVMNENLYGSNISNINKAYILLGEMEKNVDSKSKKVFLINYRNLMQELDIIAFNDDTKS